MRAEEWKMTVTGVFGCPLLRQCQEGLAISGAIEARDAGGNTELLNSKKEFIQDGTISQKYGWLFSS